MQAVAGNPSSSSSSRKAGGGGGVYRSMHAALGYALPESSGEGGRPIP